MELTYSERSLRIATRSFWWHRFGSQYLFILIPVSAFLIYRISDDAISWFVWAIGLGVVYYVSQAIIAYFLYMKNQLSWFRSLDKPEAILELTKECLRIESDADENEVKWNSIYDIRFYNNSWVLVLAPYMLSFAILPVGQLTQEEKSFIISNVNSILFRTGQVWKIRLRLACSYLAMFLILAPWAFKPELGQYAFYFYSAGAAIAVIATILSFAIRCPKCGANWDSKFARERSSGRWPLWLFALQKCPFCGTAGSEFIGDKFVEP